MIPRLAITVAMIALLITAAKTPIAVRASHVEAHRTQSAAGRGAPDRPAAAPIKLFTERHHQGEHL